MPTLAESQYYCATTTAKQGRKAIHTRKNRYAGTYQHKNKNNA